MTTPPNHPQDPRFTRPMPQQPHSNPPQQPHGNRSQQPFGGVPQQAAGQRPGQQQAPAPRTAPGLASFTFFGSSHFIGVGVP